MGWRRHWASLVAALLLILVGGRPAAAQPSCGPDQLVTRNANGLTCNGQPYRFIGVNMPFLANLAEKGAANDELAAQLADAHAMGVRVVRFLLPWNGRTAQDAINRLQNVLDVSRQTQTSPDMKFIVVLTDYYRFSESEVTGDVTAGAYQNLGGGTNDPELLSPQWFQPVAPPSCTASTISYTCFYLPFVQAVVPQFKDAKQILAWELGNELAIFPNFLPGPSERTQAMLAFAYAMGNEIKTNLQATQMVAPGFISVFHATGGDSLTLSTATTMQLFYQQYGPQPSPFGFATVHGYDEDWTSTGNHVTDDVDWLKQAGNGTPYVVEEISFAGAMTPATRPSCMKPTFSGGTWSVLGIPLFDAVDNRSPNVKVMLHGFFDQLGASGFMQWGYNRGGFARLSPHACYDMDNQAALGGAGHVDWYDLNDAYSCEAQNLGSASPDLFVTAVAPAPDPQTHVLAVTEGTPVTFTLTLFNGGASPLTGPVRLGLYVGQSSTPTETSTVSLNLPANSSTNVTLTWTPDAQDEQQAANLPEINFAVNDDGAFTNEIRCNNKFRRSVQIAPCPTPTPLTGPSSALKGTNVCVPPGGQADLRPSAIQVSALDLFAGNLVQIQSGIDNLGTGAAGPFTARWLVDGVDTGVGASYLGLPPLGSLSGVDFFWTATEGTHVIALQADPENVVPESNELNNLRTLPVTVPALARPDLQPTAIRYRAADLIEGRTVLFDSGVTNAGKAASPPFNVLWRVDGEEIGALGAHAGVPANSTVLDGNSALAWAAVAGIHLIEFIVDAGNLVDEVSETNNRTQVTVTVQPLPRPDLKPTKIVFDPSTVRLGAQVLFDSGVANIGQADAPVFNVRWLVDGVDVGASGSHIGVPAGATIKNDNSQFFWTVTPGQHTITFVVDYDNQVAESDEGNNSSTVSVGPGASADVDLQATAISYPTASLFAGSPVLFDSGVKNTGSDESGTFNVRWLIDGFPTGFYGSHASVPGGATITNGNSQFVWTAVAGTHTLTFVVDADNQVAETNEGNNQRTVTVIVPDSPRPDLKPTAIRYNAADLVAGQPVLFDSGVTNAGLGDAAIFNVRWLVDGLVVGSGSHAGVPAGATVLDGNSQLAWPATAGIHTVSFVVDADNQLVETNEANNQVTITISVAEAPRADLRPTAIRFSAADLIGGSLVVFDSGVANAGPGDTGPFNVRWLVDGIAVTNGSHAGVPAGATVLDGNSSFTWTAVAGLHTIAFFVDSDNQISETNEGNNQRQVSVQVAEPPSLGPFTVSAQSNIFASGLGGSGGVGGGLVPQTIDLPAGSNRVLNFSVSGGALSCCGTAGPHGADGGTNLSTYISSASGISGVRHFSRNVFLMGVFLGSAAPGATPPALLQYYDPADTASPPAGALSASLGEYPAPALGQSFFIGDGLTGGGQVQRFRVPAGATRLFLGFADGLNLGAPGLGTPSPAVPGFYGDNTGALTVTVFVVR